MPAFRDLPGFVTILQDLTQERGLATTTATEITSFLNLAIHQIRLDHEWSELIESTNLSFTASSTNPYATVAAPADYWEPIRLNNATDDYKFWLMEPNALRDIRRDDRYVYQDIEEAFAKDGSNILIYHDKTETLTLYFYSSYLVVDNDGSTQKDTFATNGTDADTFRIINDEILIQRTLMYLYQKEPSARDAYEEAKLAYDTVLATEKRLNPSQKLERLEDLRFVG